MANPLYGQNKQDDLLDALASANDNVNVGISTDSGKLGNEDVAADAAIPITVNGVDYVIALYAAAKAS